MIERKNEEPKLNFNNQIPKHVVLAQNNSINKRKKLSIQVIMIKLGIYSF